MCHWQELLEKAITYSYRLLADKPGQKHNLYDDFAVQDYRKKAMAICYYSLTSCC